VLPLDREHPFTHYRMGNSHHLPHIQSTVEATQPLSSSYTVNSRGNTTHQLLLLQLFIRAKGAPTFLGFFYEKYDTKEL
jgi:hypothetical protein